MTFNDINERRQQIIDGALDVFATKGFENATNKDIARASKIGSPALIYHYFRLVADNRLLIGGATLARTYAPHEQHIPDRVARWHAQYLRTHVPGLAIRFEAAWPGLIGISKDFAPVLGTYPRFDNVHFAGGAAGLPWAAALGQHLARRVLGQNPGTIDQLLSVHRRFPIGGRLQSVIGAPAAFATAHGVMKFA